MTRRDAVLVPFALGLAAGNMAVGAVRHHEVWTGIVAVVALVALLRLTFAGWPPRR